MKEHAIDLLCRIKEENVFPVIVHPVGRDFTGMNIHSCHANHDSVLIMRTNYAHIIKKFSSLLPLKNNKQVVYTDKISIIRDAQFNFVKSDHVDKTGMITVSPQNITQENYLSSNKLLSRDFLELQVMYETIFQIAIMNRHNILILPILQEEFKIPDHDQIKLINYCITKYSHKFIGIIISGDKTGIYNQEILKPQEITN